MECHKKELAAGATPRAILDMTTIFGVDPLGWELMLNIVATQPCPYSFLGYVISVTVR